MIHRGVEELPKQQEDTPRVVIIGAGTLGIYSAVELSKQGLDVVLIESGGTELGNFAPDSYSSVGRKHEGISVGRSKTLGGTTNLWGGQLVEFQEVDFEGRRGLADSKWPISFPEIRSYYKATYLNLGLPENYQSDQGVFEQISWRPPDFRNGIEFFLTRWLKIPNFAHSFRESLKEDPKISVLLNCTVVGFHGSGDAVEEVHLVDESNETHTIAGDQFILSAGTIEISRLLLHAANSVDWDCPWKENRNLGKYFQDHLGGRVASVIPLDRKRFFGLFSTIVKSGHKFQPKLRTTDELLRASSLLNIQGSFVFESSAGENLIYLKQFLKAAIFGRKAQSFTQLWRHTFACARYLPPLIWKYISQNRIFVPSTSKISFTFQGEQSPVRDSSISVDYNSLDDSGLPKAILNWQIGAEEMRSIREFTRRCQSALHESGIAKLEIDHDLESLNSKYMESLIDNYHLVGGARMGFSSDDGVVDKNLKVFGTSNLYVAGAATFRTTSSANTTFVALAFATRLAKHIANYSLSS